MPDRPYTFATLEAFLERLFPPTQWVAIVQPRIDALADCTADRQWIHVDRERAAREAPLGTTIAHGLLTLSLLPHFSLLLHTRAAEVGPRIARFLDA
jgi:acyl dehydratase